MGTWVKLAVHKEDRSALGDWGVKMLIVEVHEHTGFYRFACKHGVLEHMLDGVQIYKRLLYQPPPEVTNALMAQWRQGQLKKRPLRTLYRKMDVYGGKSRTKMRCNCKKGCKTKSCRCRPMECNSRCGCNKLGNCHNSSAFPNRRIILVVGKRKQSKPNKEAESIESASGSDSCGRAESLHSSDESDS